MIKRVKAIILSIVLCCSGFALFGCAKNDADEFTIWIPKGIDSAYYSDYSKNPVVEYVSKKFGIKLNFIQPIAGEEVSNFNNLIATSDYPDVMDISYYLSTGTVADLYDGGMGAVIDIGEYVDKNMPNYTAFLDANPNLKRTAKNDGKFLQIIGYNNAIGEQWGGFCYRRDWISKYGKFPVKNGDNQIGDAFAFSGVGDDYTDNVVFPSGNVDPTTYADWEWMLEIFKGATGCKYPMSLPFQGFHESSDLVSSFGGGVTWYLDDDGNTVKFGGTSNNFKDYLAKMNEWYNVGYIDKSFDENSKDSFYAIDDKTVREGKVGLWYGMSSQLGNRLEINTQTLTKDIQVWGAAQPVISNDITPSVFYQSSLEAMSYIVTDKVKSKNADKLFAALDYLYTQEGSILRSFGLNKEQFAETNNALIKREGYEEGCYTIDSDGLYMNHERILNDGGQLASALIGDKLVGLGEVKKRGFNYTDTKQNNLDQWIKYIATGSIPASLNNQRTEAENKTYASCQSSIRDYMAKETPKFVKNGITTQSWNAYKSMLAAYGCDSNTAIMQGVIDRNKNV